MKLVADCPACNTEMEVSSAEQANAGLRCISCGVGFVPPTVRQIIPAPPTPPAPLTIQAEKIDEAKRLADNASSCLGVGIACMGVGVVLMFIGIVGERAALAFSAAFFSLGITLLLFSQLIHIRAGLERLRK